MWIISKRYDFNVLTSQTQKVFKKRVIPIGKLKKKQKDFKRKDFLPEKPNEKCYNKEIKHHVAATVQNQIDSEHFQPFS